MDIQKEGQNEEARLHKHTCRHKIHRQEKKITFLMFCIVLYHSKDLLIKYAAFYAAMKIHDLIDP